MIGHESKLKSNVSIQTNMAPQEQQAERKTAGGLFSRMAAHLSHKKKQRTALVQETTHNEELRENIRRQGAAASADGTAEGQPQQKQKPASQTFKKKSKDKRTVRTNTAPTQQAKSQLTPEEVKEREAIYRRVANRLVKDEKGNVTDAKNESDLTFKAAQLAFNKLKENLSGFKETDDATLHALTEIMEDAVEELQVWELVEAEKQNVTDAKNEADLIFKAAYRANANLSTDSKEKQQLKDALIRITDKAYEKSETVEQATALIEAEKKNIIEAENKVDLTYQAVQLAIDKLQKNLSGVKETDDALLLELIDTKNKICEKLKVFNQATVLINAEKARITDSVIDPYVKLQAAKLAFEKLDRSSDENKEVADALNEIIKDLDEDKTKFMNQVTALIEAEKRNITDAENELDLTVQAAERAWNKQVVAIMKYSNLKGAFKEILNKLDVPSNKNKKFSDLLNEKIQRADEEELKLLNQLTALIEAEKKNITDAESKVDLEDLAVQSVNANLELTYKKHNKLAMLIDVIIEDTLVQEEDLKKKNKK